MTSRIRRLLAPVAGLGLLLLAAPAAAGDSMSRSFDFPRGGKLVVDVHAGHVEIQTGAAGEVKVEVSVERGRLDEHVQLSFHETGDGLEILGKEPGGRRRPDGGVEFRITAPARMDLDVSTGGGHVRVDDVEGQVNVDTGGGHVRIRDIGGDLRVNTGGGHLEIGRVEGRLLVKTGGGHVEVDDVLGDVDASSGGGHISVGVVGGRLKVRTGGGHISAARVTGPVELESGGGNISMKGAGSDTAIETGGGNVSLRDMEGHVQVRSGGGDIELAMADGNDRGADLETGEGDIEVRVPGGMGFDLEARAHHGKVESRVDLRPAGASSPERMEGTIGRGGSKLRLVTHDGDIFITED